MAHNPASSSAIPTWGHGSAATQSATHIFGQLKAPLTALLVAFLATPGNIVAADPQASAQFNARFNMPGNMELRKVSNNRHSLLMTAR